MRLSAKLVHITSARKIRLIVKLLFAGVIMSASEFLLEIKTPTHYQTTLVPV